MMIKKTLIILMLVVALALIGLFSLAPKMTDRSLNGVTPHKPFMVSDAAKELHASLTIADWHSDSLLWSRDLGESYDYGHMDIPRLQAGNVSLQMFTTVTKSPSGQNYDQNSADARDNITTMAIIQRWPIATWNSLTARALHQAERLHGFEAQSPNDLMIIKSKSDLVDFTAKRLSNTTLVGGLIGTEGSHALDGELANVQTLFDAGFRMMSLQHFFDNKLGASLHGLSQTGLTDFGRQVINKIDSLDIILDVSHSSEAVVAEVLSLYKKPVVVSHTGFKGHCDTARNISDNLMQQIAANGGLIAVGYWAGAICGDTPKDVVSAMQYGLELVGEDHLSLGSDYDGSITAGFDASELVALTNEMLNSGFTETQIRKIMGANMFKFLSQNLPN
jgi:microsomal dipeptidase-like Zn-dependent dipeptidase